MVICNSDYVVLKKKPDTITTSHRRGILYRVVSTSVNHGDTYTIAAPADMNYERAKVHGYIHLPTNMFERVIVRPAGVPEHWEIVRVDMPAEWEYYQDPVDGLIYQSVTGAMPPYAAVNVVRSTGPQKGGMPSHNKKYETVKQNDCQGVSPSKGIPSEISGKRDEGASDTYADRRKQMGWPEAADSGLLESTAVEAEAWADLQEQYDVWVDNYAADEWQDDLGDRQITLHQFLVSDDIDESSGCWRMVIATQEWVDTMQYKRCVKRATIGTHVVPKTS